MIIILGYKYIAPTSANAPADASFNTVSFLQKATSSLGAFTDISTNAFAVTKTGTPSATSFSPFQNAWSTYFNGSSYLSAANSTALNLNGTSWTIECWINPTGNYTGYNGIFSKRAATCSYEGYLAQTTGYLGFYNGTLYASTTTPPAGVWSHVAYTYNGTNVTIYLNGVSVYSGAVTITDNTYNLQIGCDSAGSEYFYGHISNLRIVKGTMLYTGTFVPPALPLNATNITSLLACQSGSFVDSSVNVATLTVTGTPAISTFNPFGLGVTASTSTSYSNYLNGTSYNAYPTNANLTTFTGNFTIECYVYFDTISPTDDDGWGGPTILNCSNGGSASTIKQYLYLGLGRGGTVNSAVQNLGFVYGDGLSIASTGFTPTANQWYHFAATRSGSTITLWINGASVGTATYSGTVGSSSYPLWVGAMSYTYTRKITGYVSNLRIINGTALYTSTFTVPISPLSAVTNTSLLTYQSNSYVDNSTNAYVTTLTGTPVLKTFNPFDSVKNPYSVHFNGTTDHLTFPNSGSNTLNLSGNFTLEGFFYVTSTAASCNFFAWNDMLAGYSLARIQMAVGGALTFYGSSTGTSWQMSSSLGSVNLNQWTHIAVVRSGTTVTVYVNGVSTATGTVNGTTSGYSANVLGDVYSAGYGNYFPGYISNFRVVNGTAVYTSNFTVPTSPLTAITNTVLLTCQGNTIVDNSATPYTITVAGTPQASTLNPFDANLTPWSSNTTSWSSYFGGLNNYLSIPYTSNFSYSGDFTVEAFVNAATGGRTLDSTQIFCLFSTGAAGNNTTGHLEWDFLITNGNISTVTFGLNNINTFQVTGLSIPADVWNHVVIVRHSSVLTMYINGKSIGSLPYATAITCSTIVEIGQNAYVGSYVDWLSGYISNFRVVNGTAVYNPNITVPVSAFTSDSYTSLLLHFNNNWTDSSSYNSTVTVNGSVQLSATSSQFGGYSSNYYAGGAYLTIPNGPQFDFKSNDFTIECWASINNKAVTYGGVLIARWATGPSTNCDWNLAIAANGAVAFTCQSGATSLVNFGGYTLADTNWHHYAVVRNNGLITLYVDGIPYGTQYYNGPIQYTASQPISTSCITGNPSVCYIGGYIDEIRISNGIARYTSNFAVPISPLKAVTNTVLLTCQSNTLVDNSVVKNVITPTGTTISSQNPFGNPSATSIGGAVYFNGTTDYISLPVSTSNNLHLASNNFTLEFWIYSTTSSSNGIPSFAINNSNGFAALSLSIISTGAALLLASTNGTTWAVNVSTATGLFAVNTWYHIAIVRNGTALTLYVNGNSAATGTVSGSLIATYTLNSVGASNANYFAGYISNFRLVRGTVLYTSNFVAPSAPLTTVTNTSFLLSASGNDNTICYDASGQNAMITNGGVTQGAFSPYDPNLSAYFNGSSNLSIAGIPLSASGAFTVECWVNTPSTSTIQVLYTQYSSSVDVANRTQFLLNGTHLEIDNGSNAITGTIAIAVNTWTHVAFTRDISNTLRMFVNGVLDVTTTNCTYAIGQVGAWVGKVNNATPYPYTGYISNLRVVDGVAVYTSAFTVPSAPLTAIGGTKFLTCQSNHFVDNSSSANAITVTGTPSIQALNPFSTSPYSAAITGGSLYFDGSTGYLSMPSNNALTINTSNYTIEFWAYNVNAWTAKNFDFTDGASSCMAFHVNSGNFRLVPQGSSSVLVVSASTLLPNVWYHIALVRSGTTVKLFVNGVQLGTITDATSYTNPISRIGGYGDGYFGGYIADFRITKGIALYTNTFIPPTAPITAIPGSSLMLSANSANVIDATTGSDIVLYGNVQASTYNKKFSPNLYFNGTAGTYATIPYVYALHDWWTTNYTLEMWVYNVANSASVQIGNNNGSSGSSNYWTLGTNASGHLNFYYYNGGSVTVTGTTTIALNTWAHIALIHSGSSIYLYVNGNLDASATVAGTPQSNTTNPLTIGIYGSSYLNGYIEDLRISKAVKYNQNITVPASAFTSDSNTSLLLHFDNNVTDSSSNAFTVTNTGVTFSSTSQFGGYSGSFNGTSAVMSMSNNTAFDFSSGDFTIEGWFNATSFPHATNQIVVKDAVYASTYGHWVVNVTSAGLLTGGIGQGNATSTSQFIASSVAVPTGVWTHFAFVLSGTTLLLYQNGVLVASATKNVTMVNGTGNLTIGAQSNTATANFNGYIDEIRISKGIARYTSNFSVPTAALSDH